MDLALFDFDGTITHSDTFAPFLRYAAGRARLAVGSALLSPMIAAYRLGYVPATRMRAAAAYLGFRGRSEEELEQLGRCYASTLEAVVRPRARERIRWHHARGDTIVVVSASLHPYLRAWCESMGVELICTELESRRGILTGRYAGGDCTGGEKARRVRARYDLRQYRAVYAYGDTREDDQLLALASKRYFCWREVVDR